MRRLAVIACVLSLPLAFLIAASDSSAQAGEIIRVNQNWTCSGPVDLDLVRITGNFAGDAVNLRTNCTGRIGRLEVEGSFNDCIKVNPPAPAPHDLTIESGFCRSTSPVGGHFDGIQMGGGNNIVLRDFVMDWCCTGGGNIFIQSFNGGSPENFLCDHCAIGPRHANQVRTPFSASSGVRDSLVCEPSSGRAVFIPASGDKGGNTVVAANDVRCTFGGLMEYVQGSSPPPPPPPTPEPPPPPPPPTPEPPPPPPAPYSPACATTCDEQIVTLKADLLRTEQAVTALQREVTALNAALETAHGELAVANVEITRLNALVDALLAVIDKAASEQHTLAGR